MATEIELKLALDPAAAAAVARHPAVRAVRRGRAQSTRLTSAYFDTPDSWLAAHGIALRVRRAGRRWVQTIKGPPESDAGAGLAARAEHEWPLPGPALDLVRLAATPWRKLIASAAKHGGLRRCFTTDFERRTIPLRFADGTLALLAIDRGEIRAVRDGRTRRVPVSEIEIELETGAVANLYALALALAADLPVAVGTVSKAERGHALARGERDMVAAPVHARGVPLAAGATAAEALSALTRECLDQIAANAPGLLADDDPEWVHQMRVGTRRARACLKLVVPHAPSAALEFLRAEVKWLAGTLGSARDLDVFATQTLPPLSRAFAADDATGRGLRRLRSRARAGCRAARRGVREAVGSARFHRLLLTGGLLCATPRFGSEPPEASDATPDPLSGRVDAFARVLLAHHHRRLERRAATLVDGTPEERHAARIAAKRLRYVAEFFAPLYPRKRVKPYLKTLTALQDVLGRLNDIATARRVLAASPARATDIAAGAVRGWIAAQAAALEPELAAAADDFAAARPFWTGR